MQRKKPRESIESNPDCEELLNQSVNQNQEPEIISDPTNFEKKIEEFSNNNITQNLNKFKEIAPLFRKIKSDKNSLYRAISFYYLELILSSPQREKMISQLFDDLDKNNLDLCVCNKETIPNILQQYYSNSSIYLTEGLKRIYKAFQYSEREAIGDKLKQMFNSYNSFDFACILFIRSLALAGLNKFKDSLSSQLLGNEEKIIKSFSEEGQFIIIRIMANFLKIKINVKELDKEDITEYSFDQNNQHEQLGNLPPLYLFYRTGHYDLCYSLQESKKSYSNYYNAIHRNSTFNRSYNPSIQVFTPNQQLGQSTQMLPISTQNSISQRKQSRMVSEFQMKNSQEQISHEKDKQEIQRLLDKIEELKKDRKDIKLQLDEKEGILKQKEDQLEKLKSDNEAKFTEISNKIEYIEKIKLKKKKYKQQSKELEQTEEELNLAEDQITELKGHIEQTEQQLLQLQEEFDNQKNQLSIYSKSNYDLQTQNEQLEKELNDQKIQTEDQINKSIQQYLIKQQDLLLQNEQQKQEIILSKEQNRQQQIQIENINQKIETLNNQLQEAKDKNFQCEQEIVDIRNQKQISDTLLAEKEKQLFELKEQISLKKEKKQQIKKQKQELIQDLMNQIQQLKISNEEHQQNYNNTSQNSQELYQKNQEQRNIIEEQQKNIYDIEKQFQEKLIEIQKYQKLLKDLEKQYGDQEKQLIAIQVQFEQNKQSFSEKIQNLNAEKQNLNEQIQKQNNDNMQLKEQNLQIETRSQMLNENLKDKVSEMTKNAEQQQEIINLQRKQIQDLTNVQIQIQEKCNIITNLENIIDEQKKKIDEQQSKIQTNRTKKQNLKNQIQQSNETNQHKLQDLQKQLQQKDQELQSFTQSQKQLMELQSQDMHQQIKIQEDCMKQQMFEMNTLLEQLEQSRIKIEEHDRIQNDLQIYLDNLEKTFDERNNNFENEKQLLMRQIDESYQIQNQIKEQMLQQEKEYMIKDNNQKEKICDFELQINKLHILIEQQQSELRDRKKQADQEKMEKLELNKQIEQIIKQKESIHIEIQRLQVLLNKEQSERKKSNLEIEQLNKKMIEDRGNYRIQIGEKQNEIQKLLNQYKEIDCKRNSQQVTQIDILQDQIKMQERKLEVYDEIIKQKKKKEEEQDIADDLYYQSQQIKQNQMIKEQQLINEATIENKLNLQKQEMQNIQQQLENQLQLVLETRENQLQQQQIKKIQSKDNSQQEQATVQQRKKSQANFKADHCYRCELQDYLKNKDQKQEQYKCRECNSYIDFFDKLNYNDMLCSRCFYKKNGMSSQTGIQSIKDFPYCQQCIPQRLYTLPEQSDEDTSSNRFKNLQQTPEKINLSSNNNLQNNRQNSYIYSQNTLTHTPDRKMCYSPNINRVNQLNTNKTSTSLLDQDQQQFVTLGQTQKQFIEVKDFNLGMQTQNNLRDLNNSRTINHQKTKSLINNDYPQRSNSNLNKIINVQQQMM